MKNLLLLISVSLLATIFSACASNPNIMSLDAQTRAKVSNMKIIEGNVFPEGSYNVVGTVDGLSCKRNAYSGKIAMPQEAIDGLKIKAAQLDADAVVNVLCQPSTGADWSNNCWQSIQCIGDAVKITDPATLAMIDGPKSRQTRPDANEATGMSYGTGWAVQPGYVVTNYHVVEGKSSFAVVTKEGKRIEAKLVTKDKHNDIALLKPTDLLLLPPAIPLASSRVQTGTTVFTIGYPHPDIMGSNAKLTNGIVSSLSGLQDDTRFFQTTVSIQAGNSGGPLLNLEGEAVGITTAKLNAAAVYGATGDLPENVNYAIKVDYLKILLSSIDTAGESVTVLPKKLANLSELSTRIGPSVMIVEAK